MKTLFSSNKYKILLAIILLLSPLGIAPTIIATSELFKKANPGIVSVEAINTLARDLFLTTSLFIILFLIGLILLIKIIIVFYKNHTNFIK